MIVWRAIAAMVVALAIQIGTNYPNDYADGVRGTDTQRVGPVRLVASGLATASAVRKAALLSMLVAAGAGLALAIAVSPWLLLVGAALVPRWVLLHRRAEAVRLPRPRRGVRVRVLRARRHGRVGVRADREDHCGRVVAAIPVGLLITALLVVNNLRDIPTDGRRASARWRCGSATSAPAGSTACSSSSRSWCCPSSVRWAAPSPRSRSSQSSSRDGPVQVVLEGANGACADPGARCDRSVEHRLRGAARRSGCCYVP